MGRFACLEHGVETEYMSSIDSEVVLPMTFEMVEDFPSVSPPSVNAALNEPGSPRSSSVAPHQP